MMNHIEIKREEAVRRYKFTPNPAAPRPPQRDRQEHGEKLREQLECSKEVISSERQKVGIEPDKLIILSISSEAMSDDLMNNMITKFNLSLIEEVQDKETNRTNLLVQFPDKNSIDSFNAERELWVKDFAGTNVLTNAQRRDVFSCIESIRTVSREDRIGPRLKKFLSQGSMELPEGFFIVDIDIWCDNDRGPFEVEIMIKTVLGTVGSELLGDLFQTPSMLLGRARVNQFSLNALLDLDIVASVDFPMGIVNDEVSMLYSVEYSPLIENTLDDNAPIATVIDSGLFSGHPLLRDVIVDEVDFDLKENTPHDFNGHGTGVAGIVVYGDVMKNITNGIFRPLVRICNAKVMHDSGGNTVFSEGERPEKIVGDAINYFHREYNCRVYNLSLGNSDHLYKGGRQMPWAEVLDKMARDLDIVIVLSAGNVSSPKISKFTTRQEFMENSRNQLLENEHRLIDPATASLCVTVGAITRSDEPEIVRSRPLRISAGPINSPSVFTRIGKGVNKAIKPELVDYGGNYAGHQLSRGRTIWHKADRNLIEPTLNNTRERLLRGYCGTSFAAPHVAHLAARVERELQNQLGEPPTGNLIRALLVNSAVITQEMKEWAEDSIDRNDHRKINPKQERCMRLLGYGITNDLILSSGRNQVTLFAEELLILRSFHLFKIPVPSDFLRIRSNKQISISLAYNPVTRLSRKDYLANNIWFEVYRRIDEEELAQFKTKMATTDGLEIPPVPDSYKADFVPGYTEISNSTLQNRVWKKTDRGGRDLVWDQHDPYVWILVTGKERFRYPEQFQPQQYAIVVTFKYDGEQDIQLYNKLKERVRIRERQRERIRMEVR